MTGGSNCAKGALQGRRILVVEDEMLRAIELSGALQKAGCIVLGPTKRAADAMALLDQKPPPDAALLDLNLAGAPSIPIAVELKARGIPFLVTSGYSKSFADEPALRDVAWLDKPIPDDELIRRLHRLLPPAS